MMDALSRDRFLNGKLNIWQPKGGYRAGVDAVFLAAAVEAKSGQSVLELGCGVGVASLCLGRRVSGLCLSAVEVQADYADLARRNAKENDIPMEIATADLGDLPGGLRKVGFDHVIANPPYFRRAAGTVSPDKGRDIALAGETPLASWVDAATRRLKPGGFLTMIQKADRLADVLNVTDHRLGAITVKPFCPRKGRDAILVIVRAQKGAGGAFRLAAPLILHPGKTHTRDGESYSKIARAVLRDGAALEFD